MENARQKILLGGFAFAGVGLAVLIGLTNPPSPRELVWAAAQRTSLLRAISQQSPPSSEVSPSSSPGDGQKARADLPLSPEGKKTTSEVGRQVAENLPPNTTDQPPQPNPRGKVSSGSLARSVPSQERFSSPQKTHPIGSVVAPVAPRYAEQAPPDSSGSHAASQDSPSPQSKPPSSQSNPSSGIASGPSEGDSSEKRQEIPQELLQLWKMIHSGRDSGGVSAQGREVPSSSAGVPEAPSDSGDSSVSAEDPSESSSRSGRLRPLGPVPGGNASSEAASLRRRENQGGSGANPSLSQPREKELLSGQVQQEGDGRLIINIRNEDIRKVLEMLSEQGNLNILVSNSVQGKVSATLTGVDLESALQAILRSNGYVARREGKFLYVGTPEDFLRMEQTVDRISTRVYHPNYVKASDLKDLIQPLLTEKVGLVSVTAPAEIGIGSDDDKVGGNNFAGTEAVLVRDYESVLAQIDQVVAEIDVRPMQVHIETLILSVRLDDSDKFGVDFKKLIQNSNFTVGLGMPANSLSDITFTQGGLKFGFIDGDIGLFLEALETVADANVIASPRLMVLNRHRADILIGRQEGYVNTTQTETATTQSVQFLDIGTQLRIRPFVSPDGLIRMEIHPELSDGSVTVQGNFTLPQKDVTKVTTNIMVRDGCTVVIGGLMQEQATSSVNQIPFFGNLPLVGALFRRKTEGLKKVEIIVLVTPHIVREPDVCHEANLLNADFQRRQDVYLEKMSPLGKRSVARRYLRMAQEAWTRRDQERALQFAEMAVHFDPLNREALEFRAQVWQSVSATPLPQDILPPGGNRRWTDSLDGPTVAPWILEELESPSQPLPAPESRTLPIPAPPEENLPRPEIIPQSPLRAPTVSPKEESSSESAPGSNPIRQQRPRSREILRPLRFQNEPLRPQEGPRESAPNESAETRKQ